VFRIFLIWFDCLSLLFGFQRLFFVRYWQYSLVDCGQLFLAHRLSKSVQLGGIGFEWFIGRTFLERFNIFLDLFLCLISLGGHFSLNNFFNCVVYLAGFISDDFLLYVNKLRYLG